MNNNTSVDPNNTSSSSSSKNVPKKINGTTDNSNFRTNEQSAIVNNSELPCNTCHRSSSLDIQNQRSSSETNNTPNPNNHLFQNCNANNLVGGGGGIQESSNSVVPPNLSTDEDDDDDCAAADSDDQYCVYTYKGDGNSQQPTRLAADLPSSFFKLHPSDNNCSCPPSNSGPEVPSLEPKSSSSRKSINLVVTNGILHESSPALNMNINPNNNAVYSPDMDFLEMDFDPGGNGDGRVDGEDEDEEGEMSGRADMMVEPSPEVSGGAVGGNGNNNKVLNDDHASTAIVLSKLVVTRTNGGGLGCSPSSVESNNRSRAHCSTHSSNIMTRVDGTSLSVRHACITKYPATDEISYNIRLVKSNTLPEMSSTSSSPYRDVTENTCGIAGISGCTNCSRRAMAMSISAPVFPEKMDGPCPQVIPAGNSSEDSMELEVEGAMLWSPEEAREISMNQIGPSACGATACLNVLSALGCIMTTLSPEFVSKCVGTRLRAENADLPEYLLSRSNAGTTHEDLIAGINRASNGLIYGRFFRIKPDTSPSTLNKWLLHWICKGAVPIATLNLQVRRPGRPEHSSEIPDAWHHQMIFGVTTQGVFMTNPLECVKTADLIPQLSSSSVLLVRREDVTKRMGPRTDLRKLVRFADSRWNEMNVLGQVSNMLLEEIPVVNGTGLARRIRTTHISIPAAYTAGITLFVRESNASSCALLKAADEF